MGSSTQYYDVLGVPRSSDDQQANPNPNPITLILSAARAIANPVALTLTLTQSKHPNPNHNHNHNPKPNLSPTPTCMLQIRRAYRRLALRWHPDKNRDGLEQAETNPALTSVSLALPCPSLTLSLT